MLDFFKGEPVTIQRKTYGERDKYNKPTEVITETTVEAVVAFKGSAREVQNDGSAFTTQLNLVFAEGTDVRVDDTFIVRGEKWETDGWLLPQNANMIVDAFIPADIYVPVKRKEK
jgi:hypothetical protein